MKSKEIRSLGETELKEKMNELYKELMKDNAQVSAGTVPKNPDKLHRSKKTIAQIKTILHEKANHIQTKSEHGQVSSKEALPRKLSITSSQSSEAAKKA